MTSSTNDSKKASIEQAIHEISKVLTQMGYKLTVLELAVLEGIEGLPVASRRQFAEGFKFKAEQLMQRHSETLLPSDDAALSSLVAKVLASADRT